MQISLKTLQDSCRTCLQDLKQRPKCNIHGLELELRQWLQDSTLENPMANDTHSSYICHLCRSKLEELLEFRKMCERSRKTVTDILEKEKQKPPDIDLNFNEEKDGLDENQDWLDFDFVIPYKIETTICNKEELDIEDVEPYICNLQDNKKEPDHIEYFDNLKHKVEPQNEDENNENSEKDHEISGSEYDIKENDEQENSDSDFSSSGEEIVEKSLTECPNDKRNSARNAKTKKPIDKTKTYNYKCNECDRRCLNEQTLNNHMRTHQGLKPYQCPKCNRSYNKSTHLREHLKEVHGKEKINIICEYEGCDKQFHRTESYKSHYRLKHVAQPLSIDQAKLQHICEDCGKTYKNLASLKKHQYTHKSKDEYPFQCTICDKAFTTQYGFDEHQLRHAGVKKFECPYCGMKKTTKHELQTHINYHTKEKQWHCPRCPMVFNSSGNLRLHEQIIHQGIRRWSCQFCEESFGKKDALKHHEMRHTGEKPHVCTQCGRSFIQKYALKTHMKTHNKYLDKHKAEQSL